MTPPLPKSVFITGCANGIGQHLAEVFYQKGYRVVATDFDLPKMQQQTAHWDSSRGLVLPLDVSKAPQWEEAFGLATKAFGRIDVVINNAGVVIPGYVADFDWLEVDKQVDVNVKGVMYGSQYAVRHMLAQGGGHLINFASLAGVAPIMGLPIYSATKHAVRAFSLAAYQELKQKGIWVSVICPDLVQTNMLKLQIDYPAAALSFSSNKVLSVQDIERAVFERALERKEVEVMIPRSRGWLAKIGNLLPTIADVLTASLFKKGSQRQQSWKSASGPQ